jgi:hypothetical protein
MFIEALCRPYRFMASAQQTCRKCCRRRARPKEAAHVHDKDLVSGWSRFPIELMTDD